MQVKTNVKAGQIVGNITVTVTNSATVTIQPGKPRHD